MDPTDHDSRRELLKELLGAFGEGSEIRPPLQCDCGYQTTVGARSFANWGLVLLDVATVTIGDDVQLGPNVQLLTATHPLDPGPRKDKWEAAEPIVIGDNVWLGGGVVVCPGVTIGADTVVGTTHRLIAARADVPLGSLTYHFSSLDELKAQAFQRHAERMSFLYAAHFDEVESREQFVEAVTALIHGDATADSRDWTIAYELYLAALREPALRVVTQRWMNQRAHARICRGEASMCRCEHTQ